MSNLIGVFKALPKELFRVNNGFAVKLRPWSPQRHSFDLHVNNGLVQAKAQDPHTYRDGIDWESAAPNGASMRPNTPYQQLLVKKLFKGHDVQVYAVPKGTRLPDHLLLVHERSDHYSLQPAQSMTLGELNEQITRFLQRNALLYSKSQWLDAYPAATDFDGTPRQSLNRTAHR
ncbi:hypothetical protein LLEC1_07213 [Akanthomyces lecanii]|uniref:Tse2 ADP-ribosyltransferase toxin domain-containing protein n=1 Tax=Cordyceps confragosa TaxID=2714763 RepID=A0A179III5_CORDF|nr:hypothetical protein LLEC1_07213 [Akanthomyces lecanii]